MGRHRVAVLHFSRSATGSADRRSLSSLSQQSCGTQFVARHSESQRASDDQHAAAQHAKGCRRCSIKVKAVVSKVSPAP